MCPTCGYTLHTLSALYSWCPRCGTLGEWRRNSDYEYDLVTLRPALVDRCRRFENTGLDMDADPKAVREWMRLDINESIREEKDSF